TTGGGRDMAREKHILEVYCFAVSKEVCLNGKRLGGSKPLPHQLVTVPVKEYPGCAGGIIGVPVSGDICRIRFMDTGIPYRYVTLPAHKGFLFDTALEYGGEVGPDFLDHLADCSLRLYRWLCGRHGVAGEATQNRIEELMFAHYRATGDVSLFREFSPFKLYRSDASLSFPQLARESRTIFAVPGHKERLKYSIGSRLVLSLTREQADFLVNGMEIPITFLAPGRRKKKILPRVARFIKRFFTRFCRSLLFKVLPGPGPVVPLHLLLSGEQDMVNALNRYLAKVQGKPGRPAFRQAVMVDKWSLFPTFMHPKTKILYINRRHTLVQTAMEKVRENRNNIELFIPLL
ncbi:MAG: hypothetical protein GY765_36395, partial [bacterium]|nr:hypothetical protein [bacterium]